jgi:CRP-like cAMP-binding protein
VSAGSRAITDPVAALLRATCIEADADSIERLSAVARIDHFQRGESIRDAGEEIPVLLVLDGIVSRRIRTAEGKELVLTLMRSGEIGGLLAITGVGPPDLDFVARTPATVAMWHGEQLRLAALADPKLCLDLVDHALRLASSLADQLGSLVYEPARRRLARVLTRYSELAFDPILPTIRRSELPSLIGTSREMTERIMRDFERRGLVRRVGRSGMIRLDPMGLVREAGPRAGQAAGS